jgi:hypothetical protein
MSNTANNTSNSTLVKPGESWLQTQEKKENNWNKELEFQGTLADAIEEFVEEFTMFVINTGNPIEEFTTIEDVCKNYESYNITGPMLAGNVASSYIKAYQNYFGMFGEEIQDPVMFEKATEEVIWELEHVVLTTKNKMVEKMLEPSLEVIKKILSDFLKIEKV